MTCALLGINITGHPININRMSAISGRSRELICSLAERIDGVVVPDLGEELMSIETPIKAKCHYQQVGRSPKRFTALLRWIQLAQLEKEFREIGPLVGKNTEMELIYLKHVARICPGE
ncbi:MAG: hypothetical protein WCW56_02330 [Candidatus Paceibacterota bacterium]